MTKTHPVVVFESMPFDSGWRELEPAWADLFNRVSFPCPFYHPLFLNSALALPSEERPTDLILGYRQSELVFGLPVRNVKRHGIREIGFYALQGFDHLAPLDVASNGEVLWKCLDFVRQKLGADLIMGTNVDASIEAVTITTPCAPYAAFSRQAFRCPYLDLPGNLEELFQGLSSKFRYNLRRALSQAGDAGIHFRLVTGSIDSYTLSDAFQSLSMLHEERARSIERNSKFLREKTQLFLQEVIANAENYDGVVHFTEAIRDGRVIASLCGFRMKGIFLFYQSGFDPEFSTFSPGSLLIQQTMKYLIENGGGRFDFLRGGDEYKFKWTKTWNTDYLIHQPLTWKGVLRSRMRQARRAVRRYGRMRGFARWLRGND